MTMDIRKGDCLELMKTIPDASVDLLLCDLPYGETNCKWDTVIDMEEFWKEFKRIRKSPKTACLHFCSTRFGYQLIKSWEKGFKMDMVWKKRNKTGGLQSRLRPLRNHEMIYFFYEKAPKYNRDKYHKRIKATPKKVVELSEEKKEEFKKKWSENCKDEGKNCIGYDVDDQIAKGGIENRFSKDGGFNKAFEPTQPSSVIEPELGNKSELAEDFGWEVHKLPKETRGKEGYEPRLPISVVEEKPDRKSIKDRKGVDLDNVYSKETLKEWTKENKGFEPTQPGSVVEEELYKDECYGAACGGKGFGAKSYRDKLEKEGLTMSFEPKQPASVMEDKPENVYKDMEKGRFGSKEYRDELKEKGFTNYYEPSQPGSVMEDIDDCYYDIYDFVEDAENAPRSVFDSQRVFIGKRNHQTEKPQDILEFFIKYYTDENETILDPTMGSGSTGVACKNLKRNFIGFEMNDKIFETAKSRIEKGK